jgi:hypothetical protein
MEKLVANLSSKVQRKQLAGRNYLVAPVVMILEGVFAGNQGALYYDGKEISKSVTGWNHKPITVGHPESPDGSKVSGCLPEAIEQFSVGMVLNASWNSKTKKLRAEAWFEESRLDVVPGGQRIKEAMNKNQPVEVSTGLFVDNEMSSGVWEGREYAGKAKNFRPDHLAVILSGVGACSLADGAGLLVNKKQEDISKARYIRSVSKNLVTNEESLSSLVEDVTDAVKEAYGPKDPMQISMENWVEVEEVYADYVIYEIGEDCFQENFTIDNDSVKLLGNRIQVVKEVSYKPLVTNEKVNMNKEALVKALGDEHKDFVANMTDEQVAAVAKLERTVTVEIPVANEAPKNLDELLASAPAAVKAQIEEAFAVNSNHRKELVEKIVANEKNLFSADELNAMPTASLTKLAAFAVNAAEPVAQPEKAPVYAGSAAPVTNKATVVEGFFPPSTFSAQG